MNKKKRKKKAINISDKQREGERNLSGYRKHSS